MKTTTPATIAKSEAKEGEEGNSERKDQCNERVCKNFIDQSLSISTLH